MKKVSNYEFEQHINNTLQNIFKMRYEDQVDFSTKNTIEVTFNGVSTKVDTNADTLTSLIELIKD